MKTSWIKLSYVLLGATLVFGSCVKTEESPEVIEMRKAAAAKLNADVSFRLAEVKYKDAEASSRKFQAKQDSARLLSQIDVFAAEAQVSIQNAKNSLLVAQATFEKNTKLLEVEKLNNPVLTALIKDYTAYYNGGSLSSGQTLSEGIFTLQTKILTENGTIIGLQTSKDGLTFLQKGKEIELATNNIELADLQSLLKILGDARTSGNYDAAITAAHDLLAKSTADYIKLQLAYDNAYNKANIASVQWSVAANLYNDVDEQKSDASDNSWYILNDYGIFGSDVTVGYNAFMIKYNNYIASESQTQTLLTTWTTKYQTALTEKNTALTTKNSAYADYTAAQAVVDAATINGGTATPAQITDRDNKLTAYNTANTNYNTKSANYNNVASEYEDAKDDYESAKYNADQVRMNLVYYNEYREAYAIADSKLPALETDMDTKRDSYYKLAHSRDSIDILYGNAEDIMDNDADVVSLLENNRNDINDGISEIESDINSLNEDIALLTKEIANLKAGIDVDNNNVLIDDQIKISQAKVKAWQDLLTKYQAAAAALKVKIDAN